MLDLLPPEVLSCIIRHLKEPKESWKYHQQALKAQVKDEQTTLLALSTVSKALHNAIQKDMYKVWTTTDVVAMLGQLKAGPPFNQIERLQLCHGPQTAEPSYAKLLRVDLWPYIGYKGGSLLSAIQSHASSVYEEDEHIIESGNKLRDLVGQNVNVLPNLKSVTLGGMGGTGWNRPEIASIVRCTTYKPEERVIPHRLIDLPSVETVCQYYVGGPLSLSESLIRPVTPIRVFTFHPRAFPDFRFLMKGFPIVMGAINRYYCGSTVSVPSAELVEGDKVKVQYMAPLINMLHPDRCQVYSTIQAGADAQALRFEDTDLSNTTIEIYNYVRIANFMVTRGSSSYDIIKLVAQADPQPLNGWQTVLNKHIHPKWRGRVLLKHREEAPPCASCGLLPDEEHAHEAELWDYTQPYSAQ